MRTLFQRRFIFCFFLFHVFAPATSPLIRATPAQSRCGCVLMDLAQEKPHFLDKEIETLSSQSPLLINFWSTYCIPCQKEIPELDQIAKRNGVPILFINEDTDERYPLVTTMAKELRIGKRTYLDRYQIAAKRFLPRLSIPAVLLFLPDNSDPLYYSGSNTEILARIESDIKKWKTKR